MAERVLVAEAAVEELALLGLTEKNLHDAVQRGEWARDRCTPNDVPSRPGFDAWAETTRALRDILGPAWTKDLYKGLPLTVAPSGLYAIAVSAGDAGTGIKGRASSPKYPRGKASREMFQRHTLELFPDLYPRTQPRTAEYTKTFLLLVRAGKKDVRSELSLVASLTKRNFVATWDRRIILSPMTKGPEIKVGTIPPQGAKTDSDVKVARNRA